MISFLNKRSSDKYNRRTSDKHSLHQARPQARSQTSSQVPHQAKDDSLDTVTNTPSMTPAESSQNTPQVFAFIGANGGVGTTSLAVQFAYELTLKHKNKHTYNRRAKDSQVCLIDLDFEGGTCSYHLDLRPSLSVDDLSHDAKQIDPTFTSALVSTHECGISLLAVPNTPQANQRINPHAVMAMIDAATHLYRYVIIDMPRYSQAWTPAIMTGADFVGVVSELTIASLHMARDQLNRTTKDVQNTSHIHPILNKYDKRSIKNTLQLRDAETVLGRSVIGTVSMDTDTTREAINCGEAIGAIRPNSRYVKDARQLFMSIIQTSTPQVTSNSEEIVSQSSATTLTNHEPIKAA
ncbi:MAG: hypothetical protein ABJG88_06460 [Litorimonas sp.]